MIILFLFFVLTDSFEKYLQGYYFPKENFYTYEEEKYFTKNFLENLMLRDFSIDRTKLIKIFDMKGKEFIKASQFCSRLHLLFLGCHINLWSELPKTDTKFDIHGRFCPWPNEHFCYFNIESEKKAEIDMNENYKVFHFKKKFKLCDKKINHCYNINANFFILNEKEDEFSKKLNKFGFTFYRIEELAFLNNRILKIYGKFKN